MVWLNNRSVDLKFTMTSCQDQIDFLDLNIKIDESTLYTLYRKPLVSNTLLRYSSRHPRNLRDNLPYGQFLRLLRNFTYRSDFFRESDILIEKLKDRGYPKGLLKRARKRAWYCHREILLEVKKNSSTTNDRMVCVSTFGHKSNEIKKIISHHWSLITDEIGTRDPPLFAFKRGRNVRDLVVRSYLQTKSSPDLRAQLSLPPLLGHYKCGHCKACDMTIEQKEFTYSGK